MPILLYLYIRNLRYAHLAPFIRLHNIQLVFSTCPHKYQKILCSTVIKKQLLKYTIYVDQYLLFIKEQIINPWILEIGWSCSPTHDPQGQVQQPWYQAPQGCPDVRTPRHRQDSDGQGLCSSDTIMLLEAGGSSARPDVYR